MATGFDTFGEDEPHNDEAEPVSLLLTASDDYESSQDPEVAGHSDSRFAPERWQRVAKHAARSKMNW